MAFALAGTLFPTSRSMRLSWPSGLRGERRNGASLSFLANKMMKPGITVAESSYGADPTSTTVAASSKVLVPGTGSDDPSSSTDLISNMEAASSDPQVLQETDSLTLADKVESESAETSVSSMNEGVKDTISSQDEQSIEKIDVKPRSVPPTGDGQRIYEIDPLLKDHRTHLDYKYSQYRKMRWMIDQNEGGLDAFSRGYEKFGFLRSANGITYREWAPGAKWATLIGDFNNWNPNADVMTQNEYGVWEVFLPNNADGSSPIPHGSRVKL